MNLLAEGLLVVLILANLWLLGSSRLHSCILAVATQGVLVAALPFVAGPQQGPPLWRLLLQAGVSLSVKGFLFPWLFLRAARSAGVRREVEPFIGYTASLLVGVVLLAGSLVIGLRLPLAPNPASRLVVPYALFTTLVGLFVIIGRKSALMQALGYLSMETGIMAFGMALAEREAVLVEMGLSLDVFVAVFVMGITIQRIGREFDHIDADRLSGLKDSPR